MLIRLKQRSLIFNKTLFQSAIKRFAINLKSYDKVVITPDPKPTDTNKEWDFARVIY